MQCRVSCVFRGYKRTTVPATTTLLPHIICYNIFMPNLTPFEIALLILGAVLVAALAAILWWRLAGDRVKALIAGWMALPLFWKIVLPVVFGAFVLHGSIKSDGVGECGSGW